MFFCPFCGTLLLLVPSVASNHLKCSTCAYAVPINASTATHSAAAVAAGRAGMPPVLTITHSFRNDNRAFAEEEGTDAAGQRDPASGGAAASPGNGPASSASGRNESEGTADAHAGAEGGQIITVPCQNEKVGCESRKAFYIQIQMRSADEPPSTFFRCVACGFQWRQD